MKNRGFSLVEMMVVVAIIAIIAAVAYPSYQGYISDTYRAQAVADLKRCALALERFYSNGFTYVGGGGQCTLWSPSDGAFAQRQYTLSLVLTPNNYTIDATPLSGLCPADDPCFRLEEDGTESIRGDPPAP